MAMIAKLYDEHGHKWLLIDGVTTAEHFTNRYKLAKQTKQGLTVLVDEVPSQNPLPEDWQGNSLYIARLLIKMSGKDVEESRTFKVVGLFIEKSDGSEIYRCYGFTSGYLLNGEGKTVERL